MSGRRDQVGRELEHYGSPDEMNSPRPPLPRCRRSSVQQGQGRYSDFSRTITEATNVESTRSCVTMGQDCPHCGLVNPLTAQRCDCGYDFGTHRMGQSYLRSKPAKTDSSEIRQGRMSAYHILLVLAGVGLGFISASRQLATGWPNFLGGWTSAITIQFVVAYYARGRRGDWPGFAKVFFLVGLIELGLSRFGGRIG